MKKTEIYDIDGDVMEVEKGFTEGTIEIITPSHGVNLVRAQVVELRDHLNKVLKND